MSYSIVVDDDGVCVNGWMQLQQKVENGEEVEEVG